MEKKMEKSTVEEYRESVMATVSVLERLRDAQHKLPVTGERRVQVFKVAVEAVASCLVILLSLSPSSQSPSRSSTNGNDASPVALISRILRCTEVVGLERTQVLVRAVRFFYRHLEGRVRGIGVKTLWALDQYISTAPFSAAVEAFGVSCTLALLAHCLEFLPLSNHHVRHGEDEEIEDFQTPPNALHRAMENHLAIILSSSVDQEMEEGNRFFTHGIGKVCQRIVYLFDDLEGQQEVDTVASLASDAAPLHRNPDLFFSQLAFILAFSSRIAWVVRGQVTHQPVIASLVNSSSSSSTAALLMHQSSSPRSRSRYSNSLSSTASASPSPWRGSKLNLEVLLEFLLQKADSIGALGLFMAKRFLHLCRNWKQLPQNSYDDFILQQILLVLRCIHPAIGKLAFSVSTSDPESGFLDAWFELFQLCTDLSFHASSTFSAKAATMDLLNRKEGSSLHVKGGYFSSHASGPTSSKRRNIRSLYMSSHEKNIVDLVVQMAVPLFTFVATQAKQDSPRVKEWVPALAVCFARIGSSDVHWASMFSTSSYSSYPSYSSTSATPSQVSVYDTPAAVLRCAVLALLSLGQNQYLAKHRDLTEDRAQLPSHHEEFITGVLCAVHHFVKGNVGSVQEHIHRSRHLGANLAASGEYTLSLYASRAIALIMGMSHIDQTNWRGKSSRLAVLLPNIVQRACNARLVFQLPIEALSTWIPCVAVALGSTDEAVGRAGSQALLEILKSISIRGFMQQFEKKSQQQGEQGTFVDLKEERAFFLDIVILRTLEVWQSLFASGDLPQWVYHDSGNAELDPSPFSSTYTKDLMLLLTQQTKMWKRGAPDWFRPLTAMRQLQAILAQLEGELRGSLMPFFGGQGVYIHGSEKAALSLASELVIPRLNDLIHVLEFFAEVWRWNRLSKSHQLQSGQQLTRDLEYFFAQVQSTFGHSSSFDVTRLSSSGGSMSVTVQAMQGIAEKFAAFDCLRGRIAAAYFTNLAAQFALEAGDLYEAANGFSMVANCILGGSKRKKKRDTASVHASVASLFLKESVNIFDSLGALQEKHRVKKVLAKLEMKPIPPEPPFSSAQEAVSCFFLVGVDHVLDSRFANTGHLSGVIQFGPLNVVRVVIAHTKAQECQDIYAAAETQLIQRVQEACAMRFTEGSVKWVVRNEWVQTTTSTRPEPNLVLQPSFAPHESSSRLPLSPSPSSLSSPLSRFPHAPSNRGASSVGYSFWIRRLWPIDLSASQKGQLSAAQGQPASHVLRCPTNFVLLPNRLDGSSYTEDWMAQPGTTHTPRAMSDGQIASLDRVHFSVQQPGLSPLVSTAKLTVGFLPDDLPPLSQLLEASPYGTPLTQAGESLGPLIFPSPKRAHVSRQSPAFTPPASPETDSDSSSVQSLSPRPPPYPPPADGKEEEDSTQAEPILLLPPPSMSSPPSSSSSHNTTTSQAPTSKRNDSANDMQSIISTFPGGGLHIDRRCDSPSSSVSSHSSPTILPPLPPKIDNSTFKSVEEPLSVDQVEFANPILAESTSSSSPAHVNEEEYLERLELLSQAANKMNVFREALDVQDMKYVAKALDLQYADLSGFVCGKAGLRQARLVVIGNVQDTPFDGVQAHQIAVLVGKRVDPLLRPRSESMTGHDSFAIAARFPLGETTLRETSTMGVIELCSDQSPLEPQDSTFLILLDKPRLAAATVDALKEQVEEKML